MYKAVYICIYTYICICSFCPVFALIQFTNMIYKYTQAHTHHHVYFCVFIPSSYSISLSSFPGSYTIQWLIFGFLITEYWNMNTQQSLAFLFCRNYRRMSYPRIWTRLMRNNRNNDDNNKINFEASDIFLYILTREWPSRDRWLH